ncbi:uncharacterized protein LOC116013019 [Ipomoea triloba]|uniref:uncharacterized protein LOC116013019 n=1 Tax=Ipomoea triloba TaxID=35885 RepID=UPI00125D69C2|nr:uncharacterized protein LOC116013019 [Ipomoea triloba]
MAGGGCCLCSTALETIFHLFCDCPVTGQLWETDVGVQGNSFAAIVEKFLGMVGHDMAIRMAATYWTIWIARNEALWNTKVWQTAELKHMVESLINSWKLAYSNTANQNFSKMHAISVPWRPPPVGKVKCNVDAALFEDVMGFGAVVRDHSGKFVAAYGGQLNCFRDPYLAETMAIKEALTWLKNQGLTNTILETDCLNFCSNFNSVSYDFSYVSIVGFLLMTLGTLWFAMSKGQRIM